MSGYVVGVSNHWVNIKGRTTALNVNWIKTKETDGATPETILKGGIRN